MGAKEKLLAKIRTNPDGSAFKDMCSVLAHCGWTLDHCTGIHNIYGIRQMAFGCHCKSGQTAKPRGIRCGSL